MNAIVVANRVEQESIWPTKQQKTEIVCNPYTIPQPIWSDILSTKEQLQKFMITFVY